MHACNMVQNPICCFYLKFVFLFVAYSFIDLLPPD